MAVVRMLIAYLRLLIFKVPLYTIYTGPTVFGS